MMRTLRSKSLNVVLVCLICFVAFEKSYGQNVDVNSNFAILRAYATSARSSLSLECVWFLSSLFGENALFPALPSSSQIPTESFINPNLPQPFLTQDQLSVFYQNPAQSDQISQAIRRCDDYDDSSSSVLVFLYNLLRNYNAERRVVPISTTVQSCSNFVGIPLTSVDSKFGSCVSNSPKYFLSKVSFRLLHLQTSRIDI